MNAGKYGRSSGVLKELLTVDPNNQEAKRLFATLQLRIGSLVTARTAFETMVQEAIDRQDYWLAESLLREYLAAGPRCVPFLERLGAVLEIKGDPDAAAREYAKAIEILVEDPDPERPDRARDNYQKILELAPHSPAAYRLDALLTQGKGAPTSTHDPERAWRGGESTDSSSLASHAESGTVEIPPFNAVPVEVPHATPARLPWEDEGEEVNVHSLREQTPATAESAGTPLPAAAVDSTEPVPESDGDLAVFDHPSTSIHSTSEPNETVAVEGPSALLEDGAAGNRSQPNPAETNSVLSSHFDEAAKESDTNLAVSPSAESEVLGAAPSTASGWQEVLSKLFSTDPHPPPKSEPDHHEVTIPESIAQLHPVDSPSPSVEMTTTGELHQQQAGRAIASPMPWEQIEEQPIEVSPTELGPRASLQEGEPSPIPVAGPPLKSNAIAVPMPWEQVEEQSILVPHTDVEISSPEPEQTAVHAPLTPEAPIAETATVEPRLESEAKDALKGVVPSVNEIQAASADTRVVPEKSEPTIHQSPPTHDVNTQLISTILQQADLKDPATKGREIPIQAYDVASGETSGDETSPSASPEPMPIQALLDRAVMREDPAGPLKDSKPAEAEPVQQETAHKVPPESNVSTEPVPVRQEETQAPLVDTAPWAETSALVSDDPPAYSSPVQPPEPAAQETVAEPGERKPKSGFSFLPAVLRLVGVGAEKDTESESVSEEHTFGEPPVAADDPTEPVDTAATVESQVLETPSVMELSVVALPKVEEVSAQVTLGAETADSSPERDTVSPSEAEYQAEVQSETPSLEPVLDSDPEPELRVHTEDPVASSGPIVSLANEQVGPEVTILTAVEDTETSIEPVRFDEEHTELPREAVQHADGPVQEETPAPPAVVQPPVKRKKDKKKKGKQAPRRTEAPEFLGRAVSQPMWIEPSGVAPSPSAEPLVLPLPQVPQETSKALAMQPTPETTTPLSPPSTESSRPLGLSPTSSARERDIPISKPKSAIQVGRMLRRMGWSVFSIAQTCFSTAHALTIATISLSALTVGVGVFGIGGFGVVWLGMEEKPNKLFQELNETVPQPVGDIKQSGYALLLGMGTSELKDPVQAGAARHGTVGDVPGLEACFESVQSTRLEKGSPSASSLGSWYREANPSAVFVGRAGALRDWATESSVGLGQYRQWAGRSFEDAGYGQLSSPDCGQVLYLHRLHVAEGFAQGLDAGIDRVEADLNHWRSVLRKARSLSVKMLAVAAINDDAHVLSGLFLSPELDGQYLPRLSRAVVPLDQVEASMRWPMLSQFQVQKKVIDQNLKNEQVGDRSWYAMGVAVMPVPRQRLLNDYADYYDALIKSSETSRDKFTAPNLYARIHAPAQTTLDYVINPINNLLDVQTGPAWERYVGQVREADALLRLVSLQIWLRKTAQEGTGDVKSRVAKAGQNFYDPFSGFPMLVSVSNGRLYSIGMDGKDDDAAPGLDVSVAIPVLVSGGASVGPSTSTARK
ncbi:hypothetical protein YTPLAS18_35590 [Nitrospira sp.]|nr:hypothetical protein YTPLAS18_35590 [Nitrospira sp.]